MTYEYRNFFPDRFSYLRIPAKDVLSERLGPQFDEIASFTASAKLSGGKVLIHCQQGISRSATAVLACLMINEGLRLFDAFQLLKLAKYDVEPNPSFIRELRVLENEKFGDYSKQKLTVSDRCEDVKPLDWEESVALIMANAAISGGPLDTSSKEYQCVLNAFNSYIRQGEKETKALIIGLIFAVLESYSGQSERDARARIALEMLIIAGLGGNLREILEKVSTDEKFQDITIDVPKARPWLEELLGRMKSDNGTTEGES